MKVSFKHFLKTLGLVLERFSQYKIQTLIIRENLVVIDTLHLAYKLIIRVEGNLSKFSNITYT